MINHTNHRRRRQKCRIVVICLFLLILLTTTIDNAKSKPTRIPADIITSALLTWPSSSLTSQHNIPTTIFPSRMLKNNANGVRKSLRGIKAPLPRESWNPLQVPNTEKHQQIQMMDTQNTEHKIKPKSIFIAPPNIKCKKGFFPTNHGTCAETVTFDPERYKQFLLDSLFLKYGPKPAKNDQSDVTALPTKDTETYGEKENVKVADDEPVKNATSTKIVEEMESTTTRPTTTTTTTTSVTLTVSSEIIDKPTTTSKQIDETTGEPTRYDADTTVQTVAPLIVGYDDKRSTTTTVAYDDDESSAYTDETSVDYVVTEEIGIKDEFDDDDDDEEDDELLKTVEAGSMMMAAKNRKGYEERRRVATTRDDYEVVDDDDTTDLTTTAAATTTTTTTPSPPTSKPEPTTTAPTTTTTSYTTKDYVASTMTITDDNDGAPTETTTTMKTKIPTTTKPTTALYDEDDVIGDATTRQFRIEILPTTTTTRTLSEDNDETTTFDPTMPTESTVFETTTDEATTEPDDVFLTRTTTTLSSGGQQRIPAESTAMTTKEMHVTTLPYVNDDREHRVDNGDEELSKNDDNGERISLLFPSSLSGSSGRRSQQLADNDKPVVDVVPFLQLGNLTSSNIPNEFKDQIIAESPRLSFSLDGSRRSMNNRDNDDGDNNEDGNDDDDGNEEVNSIIVHNRERAYKEQRLLSPSYHRTSDLTFVNTLARQRQPLTSSSWRTSINTKNERRRQQFTKNYQQPSLFIDFWKNLPRDDVENFSNRDPSSKQIKRLTTARARR